MAQLTEVRHKKEFFMAQLTEVCHNNQIMPKQIPQDELDAILEAITQFPEGVSIGVLSETLEKKLPRRTLQRHLARLVEQERLTIAGRGRGSRYRFSKITGGAGCRNWLQSLHYSEFACLVVGQPSWRSAGLRKVAKQAGRYRRDGLSSSGSTTIGRRMFSTDLRYCYGNSGSI